MISKSKIALGCGLLVLMGIAYLSTIALGGNDRTGHFDIIEFANGTNKTTIQAGTLAGNTSFTFPVSNGTSNYVLRSNGSGVASWVDTLTTLVASDSSHNGYLTSTDWSTFNGKQAAGSYVTALTGDVSATGPGSSAAVVNSVGGSSAANVHTAELAANAAVSANTPSTIVKRDGSGNFSMGALTLGTPLTVANGGVGLASGTSGGVLAYTASGTLTSSGALTANAVVVGGGAGVVPSVVTNNSTGTNKFLTQSSSATPAWATLATTDFPANASLTTPQISTNAAYLAQAETRWYNAGNTFYVGFKAPALSASKIWTLPTADGLANQALVTDGSGALSWATASTNPTTTTGDIIYSSTTTTPGTLARLGVGAATTVLHGGTIPAYSAVALGTDVSGLLPLANGGSNKNMTVTQGGLVWTDSDSMEVSSAGTGSDWALSGGTGSPTFSSTTTTAKTFTGGVVFNGGGSNLNNYCAGNFTITFTNGGTNGITTTVTDTWYYVRIGDSVTVQTGGNKSFTKSSSTGTIFLTGAPACILPTTEVATTPVACTVNNVAGMVNMHVDNSVFILFRSTAEDTWGANTANNVLIRGTFNYVVR